MATIRVPYLASNWLLVSALAVTGCAEDPDVDQGTEVEGTAIEGTAINLHDSPTGELVEVPESLDKWTEIAALVVQDGELIRFPGTLDEDGTIVIPDVPDGEWWLSLASPPPDSLPNAPTRTELTLQTGRTIELGNYRTFTPGLPELTQASHLVLDATLTTPWQAYTENADGDIIQPLDDAIAVSARWSGQEGWYFAELGLPPEDGVTSLDAWRLDLYEGVAFAGAKYLPTDDELTLLHIQTVEVGDPTMSSEATPWAYYAYNTVVESAAVSGVTLTDGGETAIQASFAPTPTKTFALDFRGTEFAAALADRPPGTSYQSGLVSVSNEAGTPAPGIGINSAVLDVSVPEVEAYPDPACNPDNCEASCDVDACDSAEAVLVFPGVDYSAALSYQNPYSFGQELVYTSVTFSVRLPQLPGDELGDFVWGDIMATTTVAEASPQTVVVSLPRNLTVAGAPAPVDVVTTGIGTTPTIAFEPPSTGSVDRYQVLIVQLDDQLQDDGSIKKNYVVLTMTIPGDTTEVTIPEGVLEAGRHYHARVLAFSQPDWVAERPFMLSTNTAIAGTFSGAFTP